MKQGHSSSSSQSDVTFEKNASDLLVCKPKSFESLGLNEWLIETLHSLSITKPTEIQTACIPSILQGICCITRNQWLIRSGKDVIGSAKTGSGKTAAFALPILQSLAQDPFGVFALVLTPTRYASLKYEAFDHQGISFSDC